MTEPIISDLVERLQRGAVRRMHERDSARSGFPLRLSAAGKCREALVLQMLQGPKDEVLTHRSAMTFMHGILRGEENQFALSAELDNDVDDTFIEPPLRLKIGMAGELFDPAVLLEHAEAQWGGPIPVDMEGDGSVSVLGHADLLYQVGGKVEIVELKTAHPFSAKKMRSKEGVNDGYIAQMAAYCAAAVDEGHEVTGCHLIVEAKDDHTLNELWFPWEELLPIAHGVRDRFRAVLREYATESLGDALLTPTQWERTQSRMMRDHAPDSNGKLPWQCCYCDQLKTCWNPTSITYKDGTSGPAKSAKVTL